MAKQRPSLEVTASPVSTFVQPQSAIAGVELFDQQTVNLALQFSQAFSNLSVTAAQFAGGLRRQQNEEELAAGADLINQSRKSYAELVRSGQIKPTENPWFAIGAQQASGALEGMQARAHFSALYEQRKEEDPKFLESSDGFNALAAQYAQNVSEQFGDAAYMSRAFFDSFNPYIGSMALQHESNVIKAREEKIAVGVSASVAKGVQDVLSRDPLVANAAVAVLQEEIDNYIQSGANPTKINQAVADNLIQIMSQTENWQEARDILYSLKSGTGKLVDTEYVQAQLALNDGKIQANAQRLTVQLSNEMFEWAESNADLVAGGQVSREEALLEFDARFAKRVTPAEYESKKGWFLKTAENRKAELIEQANTESVNSLYLLGRNLSMGTPPPEMDEAAFVLSAKDQIDYRIRDLVEKGVITEPQARTMQAQLFADLAAGSETREAYRAMQSLEFYNRTTETSFARDMDEFITGSGTMPATGQLRTVFDDRLVSVGVAPDSDKATALRSMEFERLQTRLAAVREERARQFGGSLRPSPNDPPDVAKRKQEAHIKLLVAELDLGFSFDNQTTLSDLTRNFVRSISPEQINGGGDISALEDMFYAYSYLRQNGIEDKPLWPSGPYGTAVKEAVEYAYAAMQGGTKDLRSVFSDVILRKTWGQNAGINFLAGGNPFDHADIAGNDGQDMMRAFSNLRGRYLENPDAAIYGSAKFAMYYRNGLSQFMNHREALKNADKRFKDEHIFVRGSAIPRKDLPESVDTFLITRYLDERFPGLQATLTVQAEDINGNPIMYATNREGQILDETPVMLKDLRFGVEDIIRFGESRRSRRPKPPIQRDSVLPSAAQPIFADDTVRRPSF
jgi:hypothetical protein